MKTQTIIRALQRKRDVIAKARDGLRDLRFDIEDEEVRWSEALDNLDIAIERLSETV